MAFRDLYNNRRKSILALLAIAVGMVAFGTMLFSNKLITNEITTAYTLINPSSAILNVDKVDDRMVELTKQFDAISDYEVKSSHQLRGKDSEGKWKAVELFSTESYGNPSINKFSSLKGTKEPKKNEMLIERDAKIVAGKEMNDTLMIQLPNEKENRLLISGVVNDISVHPASMHNTIYAYVSPETLTSLGLSQNRIDIKLGGDSFNRERIITISNEYMRMLENNGYQIKNIQIEDTPGVSMHLEEYKTALVLLMTFSFASLAFSCLIMSSLITSILSQLVRQMGILKSFGASRRQITSVYLTMLFGPIASISFISLWISHLLAQFVSERLLRISNISLNHQTVPIPYSIIFLCVTLLLPICIAYPSIIKGTKITIREALYGSSTVNEELTNVFFIKIWKRPTRLSIRNAFRKKSRLIMNVSTLTISGICFITILIVMLSVQSTLDTNLASFDYEYRFVTSSTEVSAAKKEVSLMKNIEDYEIWGNASGKYLSKGGNQDRTYPIMAVPQRSQFIKPDMIEGRWLNEIKPREIVVSHDFINRHTDIKLGDTISMEIQDYKVAFIIGGIIKDLSGATIYINQQALSEVLPLEKQQQVFQTNINSKLPRREKIELIHKVEERLMSKGISILQSETKSDGIAILKSHYMPTFQTLLIVIIMVAIVSGFGLASTTNIQTLERVKEIGIMKSFGATKKQILKLISTENLFITLSCWILSVGLSFPSIFLVTKYFSQVTLKASIQLSLFNIVISYVLWLVIILVIGRRASRKAALRAANMKIKDCLTAD